MVQTVKLQMGWDNGEFHDKISESDVKFSVGGTTKNITFNNITIDGTNGKKLKTRILVMLGNDVLWTSSEYTQDVTEVMPQKIEFNQENIVNGKPHYYIFDDHPEWIRRCDILDDSSFPATSLMHAEDLEPGIYTVFSYHHVSMNNANNNRFSFGVPITDAPSNPVKFDTVFDVRSGAVKINKLSYSNTFADPSWSALWGVWDNFTNSNFNGIMHNMGEDPSGFSWLTDKDYPHNTQINVGSNFGYTWLLMEFEVTEGTVNFYTVAYKNKTTAKSRFGSGMPSKYESLYTLKGMADVDQLVVADEMTYYINDNIPNNTKLPVKITNQFYNEANPLYKERIQDIFTTNISPFTFNNQYTTPGTSVVSFEYEGEGVTRNKSNGQSTSTGFRTWEFDSMHSRFAEDHPVSFPVEWLIGKDSLEPNEEFGDWMNRIKTDLNENDQEYIFNEFDGHGDQIYDNRGICQINPGYGITYQYTINVTNNGANPRTFAYLFEGHAYNIVWQYDIEGDSGWGERHNNRTEEKKVFGYTLDSGQTGKFTVWVTIITGSDNVAHNAFAINPIGTDESLFDYAKILTYPQN